MCSSSIFFRAENLQKNHDVEIKSVKETANQTTFIHATVNSQTTYDVYDVYVEFGYRTFDYKCSCAFRSTHTGPCKHVIATLLEYYYNYAGGSPEVSSTNILSLIHQFQMNQSSINYPKKFHLTPYLWVDEHSTTVNVSFKIGDDSKQYALQSLDRFVTAFKSRETKTYGKNFAVIHDVRAFDEFSAKIIYYLMSIVDNEDQFMTTLSESYYSSYNTNYNRSLSRYLNLSGRYLDSFMNLLTDRYFHVLEDQKVDFLYSLKDGYVSIESNLEKKNGGYEFSISHLPIVKGIILLMPLTLLLKR